MLVSLLAILIASLIGAGIKALYNAGKPKNNQLIPNQVNYSLLCELPNNYNGVINLPMYISKNNQQSGHYPPEQILAWLNSGQMSPFDMAIRQGEGQWQPLNMYFTARQNQ